VTAFMFLLAGIAIWIAPKTRRGAAPAGGH
jgi:hypothetical protein